MRYGFARFWARSTMRGSVLRLIDGSSGENKNLLP